MSITLASNDQGLDEDAMTMGNDGCTIINEHNSALSSSSSVSPRPSNYKPKKGTFMSSIKDALFDDFKFEESPEYSISLRKLVFSNTDIISIRSTDVEKMSSNNAKDLLLSMSLDGNLLKKGFRGLRLWKRRFFEVRGNRLSYYDVNNRRIPRHTCEIAGDGKIMVENVSGHPFSFSVISNKSERTYMLEAYSMLQRDQWIRFISLVILLQKKLSSSTIAGVSNIYSNLSLLDILGKGRYGVVRLGQDPITGEMFAVKVIHRGNMDENILRQELIVLNTIKDRIHSDDIVHIFSIYEDTYLVHVIMEYMGGGDLFQRVVKKKSFSEREAANVILHIGRALRELHKLRIFHLDVKPENIIYESNDSHSPMKLADMGCSLISETSTTITNEIVGTAGFMAPEIISKCEYSAKADVYSLGVTLFILLMGYPPFSSDSADDLLGMTVSDRVVFDEGDWSCVSYDVLLLTKNMLAKDPEERLSIDEVLSFPWVTNPPASTAKWHKRFERGDVSVVPMSLPSTLPGNHLIHNEK